MQSGLVLSGRHGVHPIMQILELPRDVHPYFVGTQAHPCLTSRPLRPQPMFMGLVGEALMRKTAGAAFKVRRSFRRILVPVARGAVRYAATAGEGP